MKVLITGATGLVGQELVAQCHAKGYGVNFLTTSKKKLVSDPNYQGFYWDPKIGEIDVNCLKNVTVIINLAGASISKRWTASYKKEVLDSRIDTLNTLYTALSEFSDHKVTSLVSASAIGIYPNSLDNYYEEDELGVDDSFLGDVVAAWENKANEFKSFGLKVAKVRIGLVMSAKGGALPEIAKPIKYYAGAAFGSGEQWQSWIHISDLARMFLFIAENDLKGVFNGVSPNPVTNNRLVKEIAKILEKPLFLPNIPKFVMEIVLGEMSYILFASQRVSSKKIEKEGFGFEHQNICNALENIYEKSGMCSIPGDNISNEFAP
ncbi:TIGR01777 family oxidoreductase [Maribacter chungangensis]|uniref:TIGR01777 family oxidoreductase n=1 Tax=Maribacter chungangensis TaxID=1069117 RepID=A0ABW3B257_9FLAO